jgi:hypothetical protein
MVAYRKICTTKSPPLTLIRTTSSANLANPLSGITVLEGHFQTTMPPNMHAVNFGKQNFWKHRVIEEAMLLLEMTIHRQTRKQQYRPKHRYLSST